MDAEEIKAELEKNYGWDFSSEENMEMYNELFIDVQQIVLRNLATHFYKRYKKNMTYK
jgi:hypothetical protein